MSLEKKDYFKKGDLLMSEKGDSKYIEYFCILDVINYKMKLYEKNDVSNVVKILLNKGIKIEESRDNL